MRLLDLNVLLYAVNEDSPHHARASAWLGTALNGSGTIALAWVVLLGFLRVATSSRVLANPLTPDDAVRVVNGWLERPNVTLVNPGADHWRFLRSLLTDSGSGGNLTTDAHLAALAIEHGCELCSTDADFARFPRLSWTNPLVER